MKKITLIVLTILLTTLGSCISNKKIQTTFYDKTWTEVSNLKDAEYYRLKQTTKDSLGRVLFLVKDYYKKDSALQMTGSLDNKKNRNGLFTWYYKNGNKKEEGFYNQNNRENEFKFWYESGHIKSISYYKNDTILKYQSNYENDSIHVIIDSYKNGLINGKLLSYYPNGKILRAENYENGKLVNSKCFSTLGTDTIYYPHHCQPRFPGAINSFGKYLNENLRYPPLAASYKIQGQVVIKATVDVNGNVVEPVVVHSDNEIFNSEAIRVVANSPKWLPAERDGIPCEAIIRIPIRFYLK
jgi:TonB family protein